MTALLSILLRELIYLRENLEKAKQSHGICCEIGMRMCQIRGTKQMLHSIIQAWPERTDDSSYPVDDISGYLRDRENGTMWQNPRRLALLDFIIKEIQDDPKRVILRAKVYLPSFEYLEWSGQL